MGWLRLLTLISVAAVFSQSPQARASHCASFQHVKYWIPRGFPLTSCLLLDYHVKQQITIQNSTHTRLPVLTMLQGEQEQLWSGASPTASNNFTCLQLLPKQSNAVTYLNCSQSSSIKGLDGAMVQSCKHLGLSSTYNQWSFSTVKRFLHSPIEPQLLDLCHVSQSTSLNLSGTRVMNAIDKKKIKKKTLQKSVSFLSYSDKGVQFSVCY